MRLADLHPKYHTMPVHDEHWNYRDTDEGPEGAGGIAFDCPQCRIHPEKDEWRINSEGKMHHRLTLHVPEAFDADPRIGPGRWHLVGSGFDDLSLVGQGGTIGQPGSSVLSQGCQAHFFVEHGRIRMLDDSGSGA